MIGNDEKHHERYQVSTVPNLSGKKRRAISGRLISFSVSVPGTANSRISLI